MTPPATIAPRPGVWAAAHALARAEEYFFDYVLYPYMLASGGAALLRLAGDKRAGPSAGYWTGFAFLCLISLALNVLYLRLYDRNRTDWFGFEYLRERTGLLSAKYARFPLQASRALVFCYLAVWHSPLFATLFARSHTRSYTMGRKDWAAFLAAVFVANVGWTAIVSGAITIVRFALERGL